MTLGYRFYCILIISFNLSCIAKSQIGEAEFFEYRISILGCNPATGEDCTKICTNVPPPDSDLSCGEIASRQKCDTIDQIYCQVSCGICDYNPHCNTTMLGCKCMDIWLYQMEGVAQSNVFSGCQNPNDDPQGPWCEFEPDSCIGLDLGNGIIYKPVMYDYCTPNCTTVSVQIQNPNDTPQDSACTQTPDNTPELAIVSKPNVTFTAISHRIVVLTNFHSEEVDLYDWQVLHSQGPDLHFGTCAMYTTIQSYESLYLEYGYGDCYLYQFPPQFIRLVDKNERVIANVEVSEIGADQVICFQNGQHVVVNTLDCQWL